MPNRELNTWRKSLHSILIMIYEVDSSVVISHFTDEDMIYRWGHECQSMEELSDLATKELN